MKIAKGKKYECQVIRDNACWTAKIIRQVTSTKTIVSKLQDGFATESEAQTWGQNEIKVFLQKLVERNKRHSQQRVQEK
tara:strand:+ start:461 stop:697 length:237 start_codon:yes stop_codon:yes gene_type:complete